MAEWSKALELGFPSYPVSLRREFEPHRCHYNFLPHVHRKQSWKKLSLWCRILTNAINNYYTVLRRIPAMNVSCANSNCPCSRSIYGVPFFWSSSVSSRFLHCSYVWEIVRFARMNGSSDLAFSHIRRANAFCSPDATLSCKMESARCEGASSLSTFSHIEGTSGGKGIRMDGELQILSR